MPLKNYQQAAIVYVYPEAMRLWHPSVSGLLHWTDVSTIFLFFSTHLLPDFSFSPCSADHERDWPPCKVALATNTLNVRNNNNNNNNVRTMFEQRCHPVNTMPVDTITKDLPISPRFSPYEFSSRCKFGTPTTRQAVVKFYILTLSSTDTITIMKILY